MSLEITQKKRQKKLPENWALPDLNKEEEQNLVGFFELLLKVDKRENPDLYKFERRKKC